MLVLGKPLLPTSFVKSVLFHFYRIKLELEGQKDEDEVVVCKYKYGAKGALCISMDFDFPDKHPHKAVFIQKATSEILRLTKDHKIPITWGICGEIALRESKAFDQIIASSNHHELGAHTFSHMDFSSSACSDDIAKVEVTRCIEALKETKKPVSFIFPWNREGHLPLLNDLGFIAYRGGNETKLAYPSKVQGLWNTPQTYFLNEKSATEVKFVLRLIDLAVSYGSVLHIFSHPWNFSMDGSVRKYVEKVLAPLLHHAEKKRKENQLWVCTMRDLANYCEARENCKILTNMKSKKEIRISVSCTIDDTRFDFPPEVTLKIKLPWRDKDLRVFVDGNVMAQDHSCRIIHEHFRRFLALTLSFERQVKEVRILTEGRS